MTCASENRKNARAARYSPDVFVRKRPLRGTGKEQNSLYGSRSPGARQAACFPQTRALSRQETAPCLPLSMATNCCAHRKVHLRALRNRAEVRRSTVADPIPIALPIAYASQKAKGLAGPEEQYRVPMLEICCVEEQYHVVTLEPKAPCPIFFPSCSLRHDILSHGCSLSEVCSQRIVLWRLPAGAGGRLCTSPASSQAVYPLRGKERNAFPPLFKRLYQIRHQPGPLPSLNRIDVAWPMQTRIPETVGVQDRRYRSIRHRALRRARPAVRHAARHTARARPGARAAQPIPGA